MKTRKLFIALAVLAMLLSGFSSPAVVRADWSKVDQGVLNQIEVDGVAEFHVVMAVQADVSGASALQAKVDKTTYVFDLLTRTAAQTQAPLLAHLQAEGVTYKSFYIYNMIAVTAGRAVVQWLASRPEVARIVPLPDPRTEPVYQNLYGPQLQTLTEYGPSQAGESVEWNIQRVGADDVWGMGFHGEGMVVASNDTGVDYTHPALVNQYRGNIGGGNFDHNYNWWDGVGGYQYPHDYDGHGTHTTGTMVGDDGAGNQVGMAPGAQWIACGGLGGTDPIDCFEFFLTPWDLNGQNPDPSKAPDSINNSWYDPSGYNYRPIIQNLNAAGIAVIKSAGNNGSGCSTITNPGYVPEIIATAAFAQGDTIASFSSRGPSSNYGETILKPEVAAPGVSIRSSVPGGGYEGGWNGTSMAAPHSTGLVALIWSAAPCIRGDVPLTKQIMMETAEPKIDAQCAPFVDHPNDVWGWGILDAQAAVQTAMGYCGGWGWLDGTVTDASTNDPIENVLVDARNEGGFGDNDTTDPTGYYTMTLLNGIYTVTASMIGYEEATVTGVDIVTDAVTTLDFSLIPQGILTGYVTNADNGFALEGVTVTADDGTTATTDGSGYYEMFLDEGAYVVTATLQDYAPASAEVNITSGETTRLDFSLIPQGILMGYVTDADNGFVLEGVTVTADDGTTDTTDGNGYYEMILDAGAHVVTATLQDYAPASANVNIVLGETTRQDFALLAAVSIMPPEQTQMGTPGMQVSYVYTVTNLAGVPQEVSLGVAASWQTTVVPTNTGELAAGGSTWVTVTVDIPVMPDKIIGTDVFTLTATGGVGGDDTAIGTTLANVSPDVEVGAPADGSGAPSDVVVYDFVVTNTGDYTDSFTLEISGVWTATLPGGGNTGLLGVGESVTVTVEVEIPAGVVDGEFDVTTLTATSELDPTVFASAYVTTTAIVPPPVYFIYLPLVMK